MRQNRMLGGIDVAENSIPYVARLVFDPYNMERSDIDNNLFTQCSGTIIHSHFIITSKSGIHDLVYTYTDRSLTMLVDSITVRQSLSDKVYVL